MKVCSLTETKLHNAHFGPELYDVIQYRAIQIIITLFINKCTSNVYEYNNLQ